MDWPRVRVEHIPPEEFLPTECPRADCPSNAADGTRPFAFTRHGRFTRRCDKRIVPRFRCTVCGGTFSQQSFAVSYYLKRPELLVPIARGLVACAAHRQIARSEGCAASTVTRQAARLGRHAILLTGRMMAALEPLHEPVVYDHFETFGISQYFPLGVGTPIADRSGLQLGLDDAPHRRRGRMSPAQKRRRAVLEKREGRPPRAAYRRAARATLDRLLAKTPPGQELVCVTDDLSFYADAVRTHPQAERIVHRVYPNPRRGPRGSPRSRAARERDRAMQTVDQAHQLIRHGQSHHRRETIAFGRRHTAVLERLFLHLTWVNFAKLRRENDPHSGSRAMAAELTDELWNWDRILARRLQPPQVPLPDDWRAIYFRLPRYPASAERKPHQKRYAF